MEKTKLQVDFPVETYGGLEDLQVTQPEIITGQFTIGLIVHKGVGTVCRARNFSMRFRRKGCF